MRYFFTFFILVFITIFTACSDQNTNNQKPAKIHWDRDMCARCVMVVSDRKNTVQLKDPKTHKLYVFDDIGCTVLWLYQNNKPWKNSVKIWVTDFDNGKWIDARTAFWDTSNITPMAYGFAAHKDKSKIKSNEEIIDYNEVVKRVLKIGK